jgi:hypothetical protein
MVWEIVFMLVILKIPIVYLCAVIWWAIKAEPSPPDPTEPAVVADTPPPGGSPRPHVPGHGGAAPGRRRGGVRA